LGSGHHPHLGLVVTCGASQTDGPSTIRSVRRTTAAISAFLDIQHPTSSLVPSTVLNDCVITRFPDDRKNNRNLRTDGNPAQLIKPKSPCRIEAMKDRNACPASQVEGKLHLPDLSLLSIPVQISYLRSCINELRLILV
jgi:hypothetical protein